MTRLQPIDPANAEGKTKEMFNAIQGKLGTIPNMMKTMAQSPAVLEGYLALSGALNGGSIKPKTGELIALAVAESNQCDYCLSVHSFIGENMMKVNPDILLEAREGRSADGKTSAILKLAKDLVDKNGLVDDADVNAAKNAGLSQAEIAETIAHVALNILTNYFNNAAKTELDFPQAVAL